VSAQGQREQGLRPSRAQGRELARGQVLRAALRHHGIQAREHAAGAGCACDGQQGVALAEPGVLRRQQGQQRGFQPVSGRRREVARLAQQPGQRRAVLGDRPQRGQQPWRVETRRQAALRRLAQHFLRLPAQGLVGIRLPACALQPRPQSAEFVGRQAVDRDRRADEAGMVGRGVEPVPQVRVAAHAARVPQARARATDDRMACRTLISIAMNVRA